MIFSWSCEDNYFVDAHRTIVPSEPVLNVMSATDPFFSRANAYIGNGDAQGHCGAALREHKNTTIVLIPGAPHTLLNVPQAPWRWKPGCRRQLAQTRQNSAGTGARLSDWTSHGPNRPSRYRNEARPHSAIGRIPPAEFAAWYRLRSDHGTELTIV